MEYLTPADCARILKRSRQRISVFIHSGRLRSVLIGRYRLVRPADLEKFAKIERPAGNPKRRKKDVS